MDVAFNINVRMYVWMSIVVCIECVADACCYGRMPAGASLVTTQMTVSGLQLLRYEALSC